MISWVQRGTSGAFRWKSRSSLISARKLEFASLTGTIDIGGQLLNIYDPSAPPPGYKFMRVLIVEDEPDVAASLQALIEARGTHRVVAIAEDLALPRHAVDLVRVAGMQRQEIIVLPQHVGAGQSHGSHVESQHLIPMNHRIRLPVR